MGKLADLTVNIATKLANSVGALEADEVIPYRGRDISTHINTAIAKTKGVAVVVAVTSGVNVNEEARRDDIPLRADNDVSVTIFANPNKGGSEPLDILEDCANALDGMDVFDIGNLETGKKTLHLARWDQINAEQPLHAFEIKCQLRT